MEKVENEAGVIFVLYGCELPVSPLFCLSRETFEDVTFNLEEKDLCKADYEILSEAYDALEEAFDEVIRANNIKDRTIIMWRGIAIGTSCLAVVSTLFAGILYAVR